MDIGAAWTERPPDDRLGPARAPGADRRCVIGAGLAVAGATFQGLLRNPLADPYVLGTASGAALGAAIAVLLPVRVAVLRFGLVHGLAFAGALLAAWSCSGSGGGGAGGLTRLLLTGYAVGSMLTALLTLAMYVSGLRAAPDLLVPARRPRRRRRGRAWRSPRR